MKTTGKLGGVVAALAALGACGDSGGNTTDGDLPDAPGQVDAAPVDAGTPDAVQPGDITVGVRNGDATRDVDAHVLWYDADGTLLLDEETGEDGESTLSALPGTTAVVIPDVAGTSVYVYQDLAPGHDVAHQPQTYPGTIDVTFSFTAFPDAVAYDHYRVSGTSRTNTTSITAPIWDVPTSNIIVTAVDGTDAVLASQAAADVPLGAGPVVLDGTWLPPVVTSGELANLPGDVTSASAYMSTWAPGIGEIGYQSLPDGGIDAAILDVPEAQAVLAAYVEFGGASTQVMRRFEAPGDDVTLDVEASRMTTVSGRSYAAATQTITWSETDTGLAPNSMTASLYISRGAALAGGASDISWFVHGRRSGGRWVLPTLPEAYASLALRTDDAVSLYGPFPAYLSQPGPLDRVNRNPFFIQYNLAQPAGLLWIYEANT